MIRGEKIWEMILGAISQQSAGAANQTSWMGGFELGDTQLPDDGLIQSISYAIPFNAQSLIFTSFYPWQRRAVYFHSTNSND